MLWQGKTINTGLWKAEAAVSVGKGRGSSRIPAPASRPSRTIRISPGKASNHRPGQAWGLIYSDHRNRADTLKLTLNDSFYFSLNLLQSHVYMGFKLYCINRINAKLCFWNLKPADTFESSHFTSFIFLGDSAVKLNSVTIKKSPSQIPILRSVFTPLCMWHWHVIQGNFFLQNQKHIS